MKRFHGRVSEADVQRGRALLSATGVLDGHNDLPWALRERFGADPRGIADRLDLSIDQSGSGLHTDIARLRAGGVAVQFWSVFVPAQLAGHEAVTAVLEQIEIVHALADRYPSDLRIAHTAADAERAVADGAVASLLGAEGGHCIAGSIGVLRALRRLGVRYLTLTHNDNVPWADSATDVPVCGGLSDFGREIVAEMNRVGMLVDLSHVAATTMRDALDASTAPVIFSHSSCRAVNDHVRNVPDDVLARLAGNGGVCQVTFVPSFVSPQVAAWERRLAEAMSDAGEAFTDLAARTRFLASWDGAPDQPSATLDDVVAHLDHAREVAGIDHIGIGGDYDGTPTLPEGLEDVSGYPRLFGALLAGGWSEADCRKLAAENVLRVLRAADETAR